MSLSIFLLLITLLAIPRIQCVVYTYSISSLTPSNDYTKLYQTITLPVGTGSDTIICEIDSTYGSIVLDWNWLCSSGNSGIGNEILGSNYGSICSPTANSATTCYNAIPCPNAVIANGACWTVNKRNLHAIEKALFGSSENLNYIVFRVYVLPISYTILE